MTCYHPNQAHVTGLRASGTKILKFGLPQKPDQESLQLKCGQCIGCRLDNSQTWAVRCMHEAQINEDNCFITLTYDEENLSYDNSLINNHTKQFIKRLRRAVAPTTVRYLLCGEYGPSVGKRPHYHALLFGYDFPDLELFQENEGIFTYTSKLLSSIWGKGFCTVQDLTLASAAYVARYSLKKITGENAHAHYETICKTTGEIRSLTKEYVNMSTKPGIGRDWYTKYHSDIFPHDTTIYKGKRINTPRYYETLLRSHDEQLYTEIKTRRKANAIKHAENNTPSRLQVREIIKKRQYYDNTTRKLHDET